MCGIIGYIGKREIVPILINGLERLEYRGYDSAGICVIDTEKKTPLLKMKSKLQEFSSVSPNLQSEQEKFGDNELKVIKKKGKISELKNQPDLKQINGNIGIAHTRWATHGEPNEINAHPHLDCKNEIAIVHNGIIENYHSLEEILKKEGHKIISETDSEIVAHLIEKFYSGNIEEAVIKALKLIEGAFGLVIIHKNEEKIIAARRGSPLIIGIGDEEIFVASDVPAVLDHTKKVIYLKDNEIATITKENYVIKNLNGDLVDKKIHEIQWTIDQIEKGNFKHFMLKEIFEQPETIENTLRGRLKEDKIKLSLNLDFNKLNKIIIVACGTSWHSALIGKYFLEKITRIPVEVDYASEFRYKNPIINENDLVIAISQSGETADTLAAIREAKSKNAKTMGIVNVVGSTITREVGCGIYLHAGPEIGVASTKAFTSQVIALLLFALYLAQEKNIEIEKNIFNELKNISKKIREVLEKAEEIKKIAENFKGSSNFLYLGRGINFPVALEGALKLKEISYIHAEGYPAAEMKHGPIALVDENMPVVFIATKDNYSNKILSNMQEVKARKGKIIAITNEQNKEAKNLADYVIEVPETIDELSPIINVIALQLIAYYIADFKNIDVDKPRNLAKSVTVE